MPTPDQVVERVARKDRGIGVLVSSVLLGAAVLVALVLVGFLVGDRSAQAEALGAVRRDAANSSVTRICVEIEKLKAGEREAARESFTRLDETLALLKIEKTPKVVAFAKADLQRKLQRYKKTPCVLPFPEVLSPS